MPPAGDGCKKPPHPVAFGARPLPQGERAWSCPLWAHTSHPHEAALSPRGRGRRAAPGEGASAHRSCRGIPVFEENRTERENGIQRPAEWKRTGVGETACAQIET